MLYDSIKNSYIKAGIKHIYWGHGGEETARELFWVTEIFYIVMKVHMTVYGHQNTLILY